VIIIYVLVILCGLWLGKDLKSRNGKSQRPKVRDALEAVIDGGSRIIQRRILRVLYNRIGLELPFAMTTNFEGKILAAKKEYEKALKLFDSY
jgi:hypothetical protein